MDFSNCFWCLVIMLTCKATMSVLEHRDNVIDITEPCRYPVAVGMEKEYIPDKNLWATSQTNNTLGPSFGRLRGWHGGGAWSAGMLNNQQHIGVDLGYRQVVTGVASQGRRGSYQYVTAYYIEFSSDNKTWNIYTNRYGTPKMFEANLNDDTVVRNNLTYPVVARYVRINPQRWYQFISMRIEIYGCRFDSESATFDGQSRITYDLSGENQYVQTRSDLMKMRFRTNEANGLLLYADGNQGDYFILELIRGKLYFHIDLGSTATLSGMTTIKAGSLLDDNQWHDVEIHRMEREVNIMVDRFTITNLTNGDFFQLDLDRYVYLGGIDNFLQQGKPLMSGTNFTGCMENVWFNNMNILKDMRTQQAKFQSHGSVMLGMCQVPPIVLFAFPTVDAYMKIYSESATRLRMSFQFRSYNFDGLLFLHQLMPSGRVLMTVNSEGHLQYYISTTGDPGIVNVIRNRDSMAELDVFTDGLWHFVSVDIESGADDRNGRVNVTVDGRPHVSERQLQFATTVEYLIGGGDVDGGAIGFIGCMRNLEINSEVVDQIPLDGSYSVINGACNIQDKCDPNPCEHGGICSQNYLTFGCTCDESGYEGAVCHKSKYIVSCEEARMLNPMETAIDTTIDIDDSGPLEPFDATCIFYHEDELSITEIHHMNEAPTLVKGYQTPGSYSCPINYNGMYREQFDKIIERSTNCEQYIKYRCWASKLLADAGSTDPNQPSWGWWVGRTNLNMLYWGGSSPGSGQCACALRNECIEDGQTCNCDAGLAQSDVFDDGMLIHEAHLPVMELRFGDTGTLNDEKWGEHTLGPLRCYSDNLFNNVITFRKPDATIDLPTFEAGTSGDIRFEFKTTQENGIFLQNTGTYHFIEVKLVFGNIIHFRFEVGNGIQMLEKTMAYPLNDDEWHTLHLERNRKQAMLKIDQQAPVVQDEPIDQGFRTLDLSSPLVVGAAVDYKNGYVGCIRGMLINGVVQDLKGMVEQGEVVYGVSAGCRPKCASNPCLNEGICVEYYSHYLCDCTNTPYRGSSCGREVGVNLQQDYMIKIKLDNESQNMVTNEDTTIIGFSTQEKKGMLMHINNGDKVNQEYITVEMNNNGGVKVALDLGVRGFERDEVHTQISNVDLANNQQHVVVVRRFNKGMSLSIQVDDYPPAIKHWILPDSADTSFDNPKYIYFGRNESTRPGNGFKGCLYRAQYENIYPFKHVFQDPRPSYITLQPTYLQERFHENMCGSEEVTHKPETLEFRPTPTLNTTTMWPHGWEELALGPANQALLGGDVCSVSSQDKTQREVVTTKGNCVQLSCRSQICDRYTILWIRYTPSPEQILSYYSHSNSVKYNPGYSKSEYSYNITDSSLTVHNVTLMDAGCYRCIQTISLMTVTDAVSVTTASNSSLRCKDYNRNLAERTVSEGERVVLPCPLYAEDEIQQYKQIIQVRWYNDTSGQQILFHSDYFTYNSTDGSLTIPHMTSWYNGCYRCRQSIHNIIIFDAVTLTVTAAASSSSNVALIAGTVSGAVVVLLVLLVVGTLLLCKCRNRSKRTYTTNPIPPLYANVDTPDYVNA